MRQPENWHTRDVDALLDECVEAKIALEAEGRDAWHTIFTLFNYDGNPISRVIAPLLDPGGTSPGGGPAKMTERSEMMFYVGGLANSTVNAFYLEVIDQMWVAERAGDYWHPTHKDDPSAQLAFVAVYLSRDGHISGMMFPQFRDDDGTLTLSEQYELESPVDDPLMYRIEADLFMLTSLWRNEGIEETGPYTSDQIGTIYALIEKGFNVYDPRFPD